MTKYSKISIGLAVLSLVSTACDFAGEKGPLTQTDMSPSAVGKFATYKIAAVGNSKLPASNSSSSTNGPLDPLTGQTLGGREFNPDQEGALRARCGERPELKGFISLTAELAPENLTSFIDSLTPEEMMSLLTTLRPKDLDAEPEPPPPFRVEQQVSLCIPEGSRAVVGWGIHNNREYDFESASYSGNKLQFSFKPNITPQEIPDYLRSAYSFLRDGLYEIGASVEIPRFETGNIVSEDMALYEVDQMESISGSDQANEWFRRIFQENNNRFVGNVVGEAQVFSGRTMLPPKTKETPETKAIDDSMTEEPVEKVTNEPTEIVEVTPEKELPSLFPSYPASKSRVEEEKPVHVPKTAPKTNPKTKSGRTKESSQPKETTEPKAKIATFDDLVSGLKKPEEAFQAGDRMPTSELNEYESTVRYSLIEIQAKCNNENLPIDISLLMRGSFKIPKILDKDESKKHINVYFKLCTRDEATPPFLAFLAEGPSNAAIKENPSTTKVLPPNGWHIFCPDDSDIVFEKESRHAEIGFLTVFRRKVSKYFVTGMIDAVATRIAANTLISRTEFNNQITIRGKFKVSRLNKWDQKLTLVRFPKRKKYKWDFRIEAPDEGIRFVLIDQIPEMFGEFDLSNIPAEVDQATFPRS